MQVRPFGGSNESHLPVAEFRRSPTEKDPNPTKHDLHAVLATMLDRRASSGLEITSPEIQALPDEDPADFDLRQRQGRSAIQILKCTKINDRYLTVDFEWSVDPPHRIVNLTNEQEFNPTVDDSGMIRSSTVIYVPEKGWNAFLGIEHRTRAVSVLEPALQRWFRSERDMDPFRLHLVGHVPDDFWNDFIKQGTILKLDFSKSSVPSDITDLVEDPQEAATAREAGTVHLEVRMEPGLFRAAKSWVNNQVQNFRSVDLPGSITWEGVPYQKVKAKVSHRGMERTIELGAELDARFAPAFPVEVEMGPDGRLDAADLVANIRQLMDGVLTSGD